MKYTQLSEAQIESMLDTIGVKTVDDLFAVIPQEHRLDRPLNLEPGISEPELLAELSRLAAKNKACDRQVCFLGAGAYDHFIPTIVDHLATKGEFLTAYTPYQAEASQGSLQAFYEFQTMVCQLTGMDVANASLYEQSTAVAEAVLMARGDTRRRGVVVSRTVHPDTRAVLNTYTVDMEMDRIRVPHAQGVTDLNALADVVNHQTAAVVIQSPNFFGCLEPVERVAEIARQAGAALIVATDPIGCGVLKTPGALGADIVVAEGQPLGIPLAYGGPYLGLLACRKKYLRKMPGRVVGRGHDVAGREAFCLALQTREQHIRRERATSNVCTNQGLMALRAAVYLSAMGKQGIGQVAAQCLDKAHYAADRIVALDGYRLRFDQPFFKEFTVHSTQPVSKVLAHCRDLGILAGVTLGRWYEELGDCFTLAVTEKRTRQQIDDLIEALASV
ncbi:MAG: aminomethyl-transferring glycine dehydrogenase subunit GcvPA [bacterium]|nr:aminomethyl-transferring glycine dehydrogenase subunit GcvPA [bacterium]